jgi:hypothetical protein
VLVNRGGGGASSSQNILFFSNATTLQIRRLNVNTDITLPVSASAGASVYAITGNAALNNATVTQDGVVVGTISGANLFADLQGFFNFGSTSRTGDLYWFESSNNSVVTNYYLNTTGTGTVWPDQVGGNNGTLVNFPTDSTQWVFYDDGGATVYEGGGVATMAIDSAGGGTASQLGGGVATMAIDSAGGGAALRAAGGAASFSFGAVGGGAADRLGGGGASLWVDMVGGGIVVAGGGGAVTVDGGGPVVFGFAMAGGGAALRAGGSPITLAIDSAGGGIAARLGGGGAAFAFDSAGGGAAIRSGGAALELSIVLVGGGIAIGPGFRPTIRTPAIMVRKNWTAEPVRVARVFRAAYTATVNKTFRAAPCKL